MTSATALTSLTTLKRTFLAAGLLALGIGLALFLRELGSSPGAAAASPGVVRPAQASTPTRDGDRLVAPAAALDESPASTVGSRTAAESNRTADPAPHRPGGGAPANLRGTVISSLGPQAGCQLVLYDGDRALAQVDTDEHGAFALRIPDPPQEVSLRVFLRGHTPQELTIEGLVPGETRLLGNVRIDRGLLLSGVVLSRQGRPLQGALVTLEQPSRNNRAHGSRQEARTGSDGRFHIPDAPRGPVKVRAFHEVEGVRTLTLVHGDERELTLRLERLRQLSVRVVGRDDAPVEGADLVLAGLGRGALPIQGKTDADGRYRFEELGSDPRDLRVTADGFRPEARTGLVPAAPTDDGDQLDGEVLVRISPWPCLVGRVLTPDGEAPPPGTTVRALPTGPDGTPAPVGVHDPVAVQPDGSFRICNVKSARFVVRVDAPGFATTDSPPARVAMRDDVSVGTIELRTGGTLVVGLAAEDGAAVKEGRVELFQQRPTPMAIWSTGPVPGVAPLRSAATDGEGRAQFEQLASGEYWLVLRAPKLVPRLEGPLSVVDGRRSEPSAFRLVRGSFVKGSVQDQSGTPVSDAVVLLSGNSGAQGTIQVPTDETGRFRSPPLPSGPWQLQARSLVRRARTSGETLRVNLTKGAEEEVELEL